MSDEINFSISKKNLHPIILDNISPAISAFLYASSNLHPIPLKRLNDWVIKSIILVSESIPPQEGHKKNNNRTFYYF